MSNVNERRIMFRGPVLLGEGLKVVPTASLTGDPRNLSASNVFNTAGSLLDTNSNVVINYVTRAATLSNITIGVSGTDTAITAMRVYSATLGSGSIAASSVVQSSFTVTGLTTADKILVFPPSSGISSGNAGPTLLGLAYAFASAADTAAIAFSNPYPAAVVRITGVYTILAIRS